jgi:hypothetical protein
MSSARFLRVKAELMPEAVKVNGITYKVGPVNSPNGGPGWLPDDLLAAFHVASAHLTMARRLLKLVAELKPHEYERLLKDKERRVGPNRWTFVGSEANGLACEITCQNGAEIVTALWDQLTSANKSGRQIIAGPVSESNAHAAAFAAAHQMANEVLGGNALTITAEDFDRLEELLRCEALCAADKRSKGLVGRPLNFLDFPTKQRKLLTALDGNGKVSIDDVLLAVYEYRSRDKLETLLKLKDRTNEALTTKLTSLEIRRAGETLYLTPI